jgi:hypothetical protein
MSHPVKKWGFFALLIAIGSVYLHLVAGRELRIIGLVLAVVLAIALVILLAMTVWYGVERLRMMRANRIEMEKQAHVMTVTAGYQVFIRDTDGKARWRAAHLDSRIYANGHATEPTPTELMTWQTFNGPRRVIEGRPTALMPTTEVDLLSALDNSQRCLIVGASNSGKTTLLQWIIARRLAASKIVIIDPHAFPGKWPAGCTVVGTGRNYAKIDRALTALVQLMTRRYDEIGRGVVAEMAHHKITIVIDEWRAIVQNVREASNAIKALLTESRKAAFSVFVATHSERVKALGIEGEGDLKDGFSVVRLSNVDGQRKATLDMGNGPVPARLPGPFVETGMTVAGESIELEPEPTEQEALILELAEAGESYNEIARQVYGSIGGKQTQQIKQVLDKYR